MTGKRTVADLDAQAVDGKRALVRVDFNVPIKEGAVADDIRIRSAMPTIRALKDKGARIVLLSHLGRPKAGVPEDKFSLRLVRSALERILGQPVTFIADPASPDAVEATRTLPRGGVALVENTRFLPGEEDNAPETARLLAALGDFYVNDAFACAHRAHASTEAVADLLKPAVAGFLMERELKYLGEAVAEPVRPFVAVLGGAKISGKIDVILNILPRADHVLIGGAMANTFFKAKGAGTGTSLVEDDRLDLARDILARAGAKLVLPDTVIVAASTDRPDTCREVAWDAIPADCGAFDIGLTARLWFSELIHAAKTVLWNGPMGVFEIRPFDLGTRAIATAMASATALGAVTVVGGGESAAAIAELGLESRIGHVSTGGGASLEFLEGKVLPGVAALDDKAR